MSFHEEKIETFWQWFVQNETILKNCIEEEASPLRELIVEQLDNHILSMGTLTWDLGLNDENEWFFMLSPNGSEDFLKVSEAIINEAPRHLGWQFLSSKPAKEWDRNFSVYDQEMEIVEIDASSWYYIIFKAKGDKLEIVLEADNLQYLDDETAVTAASKFLTNEIGEKTMILYVDKFSIVEALEEEDSDAKYPISELRDHLSDFLFT